MTNVLTNLAMPKGAGRGMSTMFQGDVGTGIFKHFVVTLDYATHTVYLKPLQAGPLTNIGHFDRSGMWINATHGGIRVMAVTAGGPAAQAGMKVGDVITAVDGKPASSIPLYKLRHMLSHEAPGTVMHFALKRGAHLRNVAVTLRNQI
jgi:C-terminal processing protease CtpA/Prc